MWAIQGLGPVSPSLQIPFSSDAIFVKQTIPDHKPSTLASLAPRVFDSSPKTTPELLPGITQYRFRSFSVFRNMQALRGSIRLVQRQSISSLSSVDSKSNISRSVAAKFHGSSIGSLSKFSYRPAVSYTRISSQAETSTASNNGIPLVSVACRSSRPDLFQWAAVMPPFIHRSFSTAENLVESASLDSSACASDVAPRIKFKRLDKTAKHIMQILDKEAVEEVRAERTMPDIKPGYIVQLKVEVPENKRRVSILKGIVIARRNAGLNSTFRLRRLVAGVGVESLFPLYSPNIKEIKVLDKKKVRRAKLYYLRDKMNALKKQ